MPGLEGMTSLHLQGFGYALTPEAIITGHNAKETMIACPAIAYFESAFLKSSSFRIIMTNLCIAPLNALCKVNPELSSAL